MQRGLPVVITVVGGLSEAARDYSGTVFVRLRNPRDLADGFMASMDLGGVRHHDVHTWDNSLDLFSAVIGGLLMRDTDGRGSGA
jgi:hypothetical protein